MSPQLPRPLLHTQCQPLLAICASSNKTIRMYLSVSYRFFWRNCVPEWNMCNFSIDPPTNSNPDWWHASSLLTKWNDCDCELVQEFMFGRLRRKSEMKWKIFFIYFHLLLSPSFSSKCEEKAIRHKVTGDAYHLPGPIFLPFSLPTPPFSLFNWDGMTSWGIKWCWIS